MAVCVLFEYVVDCHKCDTNVKEARPSIVAQKPSCSARVGSRLLSLSLSLSRSLSPSCLSFGATKKTKLPPTIEISLVIVCYSAPTKHRRPPLFAATLAGTATIPET